jgi:hypothetical protein
LLTTLSLPSPRPAYLVPLSVLLPAPFEAYSQPCVQFTATTTTTHATATAAVQISAPHGSCSRHQRPIPHLSSHSHQSTHSTHPARSLPVSAAVGVWFCSAPRLPPRRSMDEASEGVVAAAALFMRGRVRMLMMAPRTIVALRQG